MSNARTTRTTVRRIAKAPAPKPDTAKKAAVKPSRTRTTRQSTPAAPPRPAGKLGLICDRLSADAGATTDELVADTGWQPHTVRAALSRLRARGFGVLLDSVGERRAYRLGSSRDDR